MFENYGNQPAPNSERAMAPSCFSVCDVRPVKTMEIW